MLQEGSVCYRRSEGVGGREGERHSINQMQLTKHQQLRSSSNISAVCRMRFLEPYSNGVSAKVLLLRIERRRIVELPVPLPNVIQVAETVLPRARQTGARMRRRRLLGRGTSLH